MKAATTNLPTLPTGVRVRKVRGENKLELVFVAPVIEVEEVAPAAVESVTYVQAAKEIEAGAEALKEAFYYREVATPTSVKNASVFGIVAKIYAAPSVLPVASKIDYSQKGNLNGSNRGFNLFR